MQLETLEELRLTGTLKDLRGILALAKESADGCVKQAAHLAASAIIRRSLIDHYDALAPNVREGLVAILKAIDPRCARSVIEEMNRLEGDQRIRAIYVLGLMGCQDSTKDALAQLTCNPSVHVRATAVTVLKQMISEGDAALIIPLLKDQDDRVVANTIEVLAEIGDRLIPLIIRFISHPNNRVRGNALKATWQSRRKDVHRVLKQMVEDGEHPLMRATACWVIGECATHLDRHFTCLLHHCRNDPEDQVRENAERALTRIEGLRQPS